MVNLPFINQKYRKSGFKFIPDDNGSAVLLGMRSDHRGYMQWGGMPSIVWLLPDGLWSSVSIEPFKRYKRFMRDRYVYDRKGDVLITGRFPNFIASDTGDQVWLDYNRSFTTYPVDFFDRLKVKDKPKVVKQPLTVKRVIRQDQYGWSWEVVAMNGRVMACGAEETRSEAIRESTAQARHMGVAIQRNAR